MSEIKIKAKWYETEEESDMSSCAVCMDIGTIPHTKAPNMIDILGQCLDLCDDHLEEIKTK